MKTLLVLTLVLAGVWLWFRQEKLGDERALAAVATELAGRPVSVDCEGFFSALLNISDRTGEVRYDDDGRAPKRTYLTRGVCKDLKRFRTSSSHPELDCLEHLDWAHVGGAAAYGACGSRARDTAEAIATLAHESMHLRGFVSESQAQCYAIQTAAWTAMRLGGTEGEGAAVARFLLALQSGMPSEYQSSDCRAGGSLDLYPGTPAFPSESPPVLPPPGLVGPAWPG